MLDQGSGNAGTLKEQRPDALTYHHITCTRFSMLDCELRNRGSGVRPNEIGAESMLLEEVDFGSIIKPHLME